MPMFAVRFLRSSQSGASLWEKKFCTSVCSIPWEKVCWAKFYLSSHKNILNWDDSAAFEAFQNSKSRYYADINGLPFEIPLPDPDQCIDEVDHNAVIDTKLIEDLESPHSLPEFDEKTEVIFENEVIPVTGWGKAVDGNTEEQHSVNWDKFVEKDGGSDTLWNSECNDLWKNEQGARNSRKRNGDGYCEPVSSKSRKMNERTEENIVGYQYEKVMRDERKRSTRESKPRRCRPVHYRRSPESGNAWHWEKSVS
ncbi:uncharacterized protein A4U43_C02F18930 [Asparagus officinalis]|uniref:Uncharacterized protein n=1 Tax=Asparagus officinalis TaxID=4686 RepID=A0A5P1FK10_ASPOF|nr:uncharacterized protein A4U43_C02F18930 [Asparagus officinalis]